MILPLGATEVQKDEKPLKVQRNKDPQEGQRVKNDYSSFVGEDVQFGRTCRRPTDFRL